MSKPVTKPYGSWKSPITPELIVSATIRFEEVAIDGNDIYWTESRPSEGGRTTLVKQAAALPAMDVTPLPFNVRTRVHEYGGGAFVVDRGTAYFSNFAESRLYRQVPGQGPAVLTAGDNLRYADAAVDTARNRLICVCEDHSVPGQEALNSIVAVPLSGGSPGEVLVSGNDFYSNPRLSPDGTRLAWLTWNHPYMPWDGTELWVADVDASGGVQNPVKVAGQIGKESVFQPSWSPDSVLYFVSDKTDWWNLYRYNPNTKKPEPITQLEAEFGLPQWVFGLSTYDFSSEREIICTYNRQGTWQLARIDLTTQSLQDIPTPYTLIGHVKATSDFAVFIAGSATQAQCVVKLDLQTERVSVLKRSTEVSVDEGFLSVPQAIEFSTDNGLTAFGFFYAPRNIHFEAPLGERPPLIVFSHGGPTSATSAQFNLSIQYWTSRGLGVLDVNYGGSSGYGRAYRDRLLGTWGITDVQDCVNGAQWLADRGDVDSRRLGIRGGSAGGYTTLAALTFKNAFQVGASYFGISDLELLARDTHKFESRYMERLVGPYPECKDLFEERSPIHFTDKLSCPVIFFQGLDDKVVPPNQAEVMVEKLKAKGLPVAYVTFEGEGHGFRKSENIKRTLEAELYFYSKVLGFDLAEAVEPVPIENL